MDTDVISILATLDFQALMSTVVLSALAVWILVRKPLGVPPGPRWRTPILGNLREFASHFGLKSTLKGLRSTYGDIYSLFLGRRFVVIVSGTEAIRRMLKKDEKLLERTAVFGEMTTFENSSLKLNKDITNFNQSLELVLGKSHIMQEKISNSVEIFTDILNKKPGNAFDPVGPISKSVTHLVWATLWDEKQRADNGDTALEHLESLCEELSHLRGEEVLLWLVPAVRYVPSERARCQQIDKLRSGIYNIFNQEMKESKSMWDWREDDVLSTYFDIIRKERDGDAMQDSKLCELLVSAYLILTKSITTMVYSAVWFLMVNPDLQKQLYAEISQTSRLRKQTNIRDTQRHRLTDAFIFETKRFVKMNSLLDYSRKTTGEVKLLGYWIPKNTLVFADMESLMTDPSIWNDPSEFQPARFLSDVGPMLKDECGLKYLGGDETKWMSTFIDTTVNQYITGLLRDFRIEKPAHVQPGRYDKNGRFTAYFVPRLNV